MGVTQSLQMAQLLLLCALLRGHPQSGHNASRCSSAGSRGRLSRRPLHQAGWEGRRSGLVSSSVTEMHGQAWPSQRWEGHCLSGYAEVSNDVHTTSQSHCPLMPRIYPHVRISHLWKDWGYISKSTAHRRCHTIPGPQKQDCYWSCDSDIEVEAGTQMGPHGWIVSIDFVDDTSFDPCR